MVRTSIELLEITVKPKAYISLGVFGRVGADNAMIYLRLEHSKYFFSPTKLSNLKKLFS